MNTAAFATQINVAGRVEQWNLEPSIYWRCAFTIMLAGAATLA
jgi:hypothetical protein